MISYFLGIPGSGKTYYSVNIIYQNFYKDTEILKKQKKELSFKKDYKYCYTNINELKFKKLKNVKKLDFDDFEKKLIILYHMYKKEKVSDKVLIEKAKELKLYKILFVIDEAHNYFDVNKPVLVWWLTYHRHLYHDVFLITQNLALINSKYKPLAERFYRAKPLSLSLNKSYFYYSYFTDSRMTKASLVEVVKIKKNKYVFDLYQSGDVVHSKNIILKYLKFAFFIFLLFIFLGYFFISSKMDSVNDKNVSYSSSVPVVSSVPVSFVSGNEKFTNVIDTDKKDLHLIIFICNSESICKYNDKKVNLDVIKYAFDEFNSKYISKYKVQNLIYYYVSASPDFMNFFNDFSSDSDSQKDDIKKLSTDFIGG